MRLVAGLVGVVGVLLVLTACGGAAEQASAPVEPAAVAGPAPVPATALPVTKGACLDALLGATAAMTSADASCSMITEGAIGAFADTTRAASTSIEIQSVSGCEITMREEDGTRVDFLFELDSERKLNPATLTCKFAG